MDAYCTLDVFSGGYEYPALDTPLSMPLIVGRPSKSP
jgi:hypothetical protein